MGWIHKLPDSFWVEIEMELCRTSELVNFLDGKSSIPFELKNFFSYGFNKFGLLLKGFFNFKQPLSILSSLVDNPGLCTKVGSYCFSWQQAGKTYI